METPSSTRRITRSQTVASSASAISRKTEESEKNMTKSYTKTQNQDRSALIDITNDSPIVGLAMGNLNTPTSAMSKKRNNSIAKFIRTPGSGEALLRGQVKTLLQKVEEEAEFSKISIENRPFLNLQGISLVAPTPANTPQILDVTLPSVTEKTMIPLQMVNEIIEENGIESENNLVTRSLLMDFSEKSDFSDCSSVVTTYQEISREKDDEDSSSIWSIQVNASSTPDDEEEFEEYFEEEEEFDKSSSDGEDVEILEEYGSNDAIIDELCEGINKIKFAGKHIRFVYNSDDELDGEEEVATIGDESGKTKGIRFCLELEDEI